MTEVSQEHTLSTATAITPFSFEGAPVRVVTRDGEPWFLHADACRALGIANASNAAARLDSEDKSTLRISESGEINGLGATGEMPVIINESGLYTLVLRCHGATTPGTVPHRFRRWVTGTVLPSIRKTGSYTAPGAVATLSPETLREIIAIVVAGVREQVAQQVRALLIEHDPGALAVTGYVSSLEILKDHDVPPRRRRGISQRVTRHLRDYCIKAGKGDTMRRERSTDRYLFQEDVARDWLRAGGKAMIVEHKAAIAGQTAFKFGKGRAGENVVPMNPGA